MIFLTFMRPFAQIMLIYIIFPFLALIPGINDILQKVLVAVLGELSLFAHWLELIYEFINPSATLLAESLPAALGSVLHCSALALLEAFVIGACVKFFVAMISKFSFRGILLSIPIIPTILGFLVGMFILDATHNAPTKQIILIVLLMVGIRLMLGFKVRQFYLGTTLIKVFSDCLLGAITAFLFTGYAALLCIISTYRIQVVNAILATILLATALILAEFALASAEKKLG